MLRYITYQIRHPQPTGPAAQKCHISPTTNIHYCLIRRHHVYKNLLPRNDVSLSSLFLKKPVVLLSSPTLSWTSLPLSPPNFYIQRLINQYKMSARSCTQDVSLTADTSDDSSFNMSQELNRPPCEKARTYPESCRPYEDVFNFSHAPQISTVALPKQEGGEDFVIGGYESNLGLQLGGGLIPAETLDSEPEAILLGCLDDVLPELLAMDSDGGLMFCGFD